MHSSARGWWGSSAGLLSDRDKTIGKIVTQVQVKNSSDNSDSEWEKIDETCKKNAKEIEVMSERNKTTDTTEPTPLPRKGLLDQANNNTNLNYQEAEKQGNIAQKRRDKNSSHPGEKIPTVADRIESLKKEGLDIHQ